MPLYKCTPAQYSGFLRYFNGNCVNGMLGRNELRAIMARAGVQTTNAELTQMIDLISVDSNGVSWQCFIDYVSSYVSFRDVEQEYADAFRIYDVSGNGVLSRDDIRYVMNKLGMKIDIDKLMDEVDTNKDGAIQYDEFVHMMKMKIM